MGGRVGPAEYILEGMDDDERFEYILMYSMPQCSTHICNRVCSYYLSLNPDFTWYPM